MDLKIYATGHAFQNNSDLKSVIDLLSNYQLSFYACLEKAADREGVQRPNYPSVKLISVESGSIDIKLATDVAAAVAPIAPSIFGYAWNVYKAAYDLVTIATNYFSRRGEPVNITIIDSPGAVANVVNGDQIQTTKDVFDATSQIHPWLDKIASLVKADRAERIVFSSEEDRVLTFDDDNKNSFKVQSVQRLEDEPIQIECNIYKLNKKTLNGYVEYDDNDEPVVKPFTAEADIRNELIAAFGKPRIKATVQREMETNALGETRIKRFHILSVDEIIDNL